MLLRFLMTDTVVTHTRIHPRVRTMRGGALGHIYQICPQGPRYSRLSAGCIRDAQETKALQQPTANALTCSSRGELTRDYISCQFFFCFGLTLPLLLCAPMNPRRDTMRRWTSSGCTGSGCAWVSNFSDARSRHRLFPSSAARARVGLKNAIMQRISIRTAIYWRNSGVESRCGSLRSARMNTGSCNRVSTHIDNKIMINEIRKSK
jgi:hypothetical protein